MKNEEWKQIPKHPLYEVSDLGRIRRTTYLQPYVDSNGYLTVAVWGDNRPHRLRVHRSVAAAFVPNPEQKLEVNHKDGNKLNPRADNLEWVTRLENQRHAIKLGLRNNIARGEKSGLAKLTAPQVVCIRKFAGIWRQRSMARKFCLTQHAIWCVVERVTWKHVP
jgi:hypothetical protein